MTFLAHLSPIANEQALNCAWDVDIGRPQDPSLLSQTCSGRRGLLGGVERKAGV